MERRVGAMKLLSREMIKMHLPALAWTWVGLVIIGLWGESFHSMVPYVSLGRG